jgi:hypothetical protein
MKQLLLILTYFLCRTNCKRLKFRVVTDDTKQVPGTSILVKGTSKGTSTDDGKYPYLQLLRCFTIYFIDMKENIKVTGSTINVTLAESENYFDIVVLFS